MNAKKVSCWVMVGGCVLAAMAVAAAAQDQAPAPDLAANLDITYVSKYVWRGIAQTREGAMQPSLTLTHKSGLSFNFWASNDFEAGKLTETDYSLNYAWSIANISWSAGYVYYAFPNTPFASTSEVYASAGFGGAFTPTLSISYDVGEAKGYYASLGVGYAVPLSGMAKSTALDLSAKLSVSSANDSKFYYGVDKTALSDLCLTAAAPIGMKCGVGITPSLCYTTVIDGSLRRSLSWLGLKPDNLVGALTVACAF